MQLSATRTLFDTITLQNLEVIFNFDDGSDEITCAAFNPVNPCLFAFADVSGNVGLRAIDRALDAAITGAANVDFAVNCMGEERATAEIAGCCSFLIVILQAGRATESCWP